MFDDGELEQIKGRIEEERPSEGRVVRKDFVFSLFISVFAAMLVIYLSLSSLAMVSVALSVGGSGGFLLEFEELKQETLAGEEPDDFFIYPVAAETSNCESTIDTTSGKPDPADNDQALPLLKAQIEEAEVGTNTSFSFKKAIKTPNITGINNITVELNNEIEDSSGGTVGFGDVDIGNTSIILSELRADRLQLTNATIDERKSDSSITTSDSDFEIESPFGPSPGYVRNPDPATLGELVVDGEEVIIKKGSGVAHFIGFESLRVTSLNLELKYDAAEAPVSDQNCPV